MKLIHVPASLHRGIFERGWLYFPRAAARRMRLRAGDEVGFQGQRYGTFARGSVTDVQDAPPDCVKVFFATDYRMKSKAGRR